MLTEEAIKKEVGLIQAASADRHWLEKARAIAESIGEDTGFCSIEDVRLNWPDDNFPSGGWCGATFRDKNIWQFDSYMKTFHDESHTRPVVLWRYLGPRI